MTSLPVAYLRYDLRNHGGLDETLSYQLVQETPVEVLTDEHMKLVGFVVELVWYDLKTGCGSMPTFHLRFEQFLRRGRDPFHFDQSQVAGENVPDGAHDLVEV